MIFKIKNERIKNVFPLSFIYWLLFLISLGGIGFKEAGVDSTPYFNLQNFYFTYMSCLKYTPIIINIIIYVYMPQKQSITIY